MHLHKHGCESPLSDCLSTSSSKISATVEVDTPIMLLFLSFPMNCLAFVTDVFRVFAGASRKTKTISTLFYLSQWNGCVRVVWTNDKHYFTYPGIKNRGLISIGTWSMDQSYNSLLSKVDWSSQIFCSAWQIPNSFRFREQESFFTISPTSRST